MNYKYKKCRKFFDNVAEVLDHDYVVVASCNKDLSAYLVPKGTEKEISYYGKPELSFRVSDHWNWYSNLNKCNKPDEVQCFSVDVEEPLSRDPEHFEKATNGRQVYQVALYRDGKYHGVYGDIWNPERRQYEWKESDPAMIALLV